MHELAVYLAASGTCLLRGFSDAVLAVLLDAGDIPAGLHLDVADNGVSGVAGYARLGRRSSGGRALLSGASSVDGDIAMRAGVTAHDGVACFEVVT
ncbi:hypothetical protein [Xanthomonas sp. NCPPB 2632]|uniref:hypothetical protein n=1 Tax=Xanthomonas sp. NCPPB 2632 TaxID=3240912 RepID=UPI003517B5B6